MSSGQMSENVRCANCDNYKDSWCEKIVDSPHPDIPRDCEHYRVRTQMSSADCISRAAAIDAIESHLRTIQEPYRLNDTDEIMNYAFEVAASCVYNLPSAEPEQTCEYWDSESKFCALCRPSAQPERKTDGFTTWAKSVSDTYQKKAIIEKFRDYQIEWLTSHYDIEFCKDEEDAIVRFLRDTASCFGMDL